VTFLLRMHLVRRSLYAVPDDEFFRVGTMFWLKTEQIRRIVFVLQRNQSLVVGSIPSLDPIFAFVTQVVDIHPS
jgi:hypothetical protein